MRALLRALTYGKRVPISVLQRNNQQSLDTAGRIRIYVCVKVDV